MSTKTIYVVQRKVKNRDWRDTVVDSRSRKKAIEQCESLRMEYDRYGWKHRVVNDAEFLKGFTKWLMFGGIGCQEEHERLTAIAERIEALDSPPKGNLWCSFMHHVGCDKCDAMFSRETHRQGDPCPVCQPLTQPPEQP